jgi:hypothetical protein
MEIIPQSLHTFEAGQYIPKTFSIIFRAAKVAVLGVKVTNF